MKKFLSLKNLKDWKTTLPFGLAAAATMVLQDPMGYDVHVVTAAKYVQLAGLVLGGINASGVEQKDEIPTGPGGA